MPITARVLQILGLPGPPLADAGADGPLARAYSIISMNRGRAITRSFIVTPENMRWTFCPARKRLAHDGRAAQ